MSLRHRDRQARLPRRAPDQVGAFVGRGADPARQGSRDDDGLDGLWRPQGTKYPNQSWAFIRHLAKTLPASGTGNAYVPALRLFTLTPEYLALYPESGRQAYVDSVQVAYTLPVLPASARIAEADFTPILTGEKSAADGLQRVRERLQPPIRKWLEQTQK